MRWRDAYAALVCLVIGASVSACVALSTARPDQTVLPSPSVETSAVPGPPSVATPTMAQSSKSPKPMPAKPSAKPKSPPRGNPTGVRITRKGKSVMAIQPIGGSVGLVKDGQGRNVIDPPTKGVWWYQEQDAWPKPGYPGPSVLVGHISSQGRPGPFWDLKDVRKGDVVTVTYSSRDTVSFIVTRVKHPQKVELPPDIWIKTQKPVLRLVTCDPNTPFVNGHYLGNVLVYADRMV